MARGLEARRRIQAMAIHRLGMATTRLQKDGDRRLRAIRAAHRHLMGLLVARMARRVGRRPRDGGRLHQDTAMARLLEEVLVAALEACRVRAVRLLQGILMAMGMDHHHQAITAVRRAAPALMVALRRQAAILHLLEGTQGRLPAMARQAVLMGRLLDRPAPTIPTMARP